MRALVFHGPHEMTVEERPDPAPGPGEVLLDVLAVGICGSDLHGYTGENGRRHPGQVMGHEFEARVVATDGAGPPVGTRVTVNPVIGCGRCDACLAGDTQQCPDRRVIGVDRSYSSAFAERMVAPVANLVSLPATAPADVGSLVEPLAVGYHAAVRGGIRGDVPVLVIGGGPIGQASALAARRLGARVVVSEPAEGRRALVASLGFDTVDPTADDVPAAVAEVLAGRPTVVLDAVGTDRTVADALAASSRGATVVLVGMGSRRLDLAAYAISTEERSLVGSFCYSVAEFAGTAAWAAAHAEQLLPLVEARVPLGEGPAAFRGLAEGRITASKVLVLPQADASAGPATDRTGLS